MRTLQFTANCENHIKNDAQGNACHVTQEYVDLMRECIAQVSDRSTLRNCKLFFEAFMGFYKVYGPK